MREQIERVGLFEYPQTPWGYSSTPGSLEGEPGTVREWLTELRAQGLKIKRWWLLESGELAVQYVVKERMRR